MIEKENERNKNGRAVSPKMGIVNLGCARNLVDSQEIVGRFKKNGYSIVSPQEAEVVVVNTCSFIEDAKKESIDVILDLIELKKQGRIKKLVVAGCLAQRYGEKLSRELREIDAIIGVPTLLKDAVPESVILTPKHFSYVKICESCFNHCHFCVIPQIKGRFLSRTIDSIVSEVKNLDKSGVKEINIIGQDITSYGMDLYHEKKLAQLLKEIVSVCSQVKWIRLLYTYPTHITDELLDVIAENDKICSYVDVPLQHINNSLLKSMNRSMSSEQIRTLIFSIRKRIPNVFLRTTFIVGLPGETEERFEELVSFIKEMRFERLGVFQYSREEGTVAYDMPDQVPEAVKQIRQSIIMEEQQKISQDIQAKMIDQKIKVLIDQKQANQENIYIGRTEFDAPDVDGLVYVHSNKILNSGDFVSVRIKDSLEYDLVGDLDVI